MSGVRVRIAPSPTGPIHIGLARTALYNFLFARARQGTFLLRIDDTDRERSTAASLQQIFAGLRWLGLQWDEGPEVGGPYGPYFQSQRYEGYRARARTLLEGGHAYPCFCSPERIAQGRGAMQDATGAIMYDRLCRGLSPDERARRIAQGEPHTVRFAIPAGSVVIDDRIKGRVEVGLDQIDDWVMLRADGSPLYNYCSTLDDIDMRITDVIRGEEHFLNTVKQILLFRALGAEPPRFAHLPLILGKDGKKLSKRKAQTNLLDYRDQGYPPEALLNFLALLGWGFDGTRDVFTLEEAIDRFELEVISQGGSIYDDEKMLWMCGVYVRQTDLDLLLDRVTPFLVQAGPVTAADIAAARPWFRNAVACYQERFRIYSELPAKLGWLFAARLAYDDKAAANLRKSPAVGDWLDGWLRCLSDVNLPPSRPQRPVAADEAVRLPTKKDVPFPPAPYATPPEIEAASRRLAETLGIGFGQLVHPIRAALTGTTEGASLFDVVYLLGREQVEARVRAAVEWLRSDVA